MTLGLESLGSWGKLGEGCREVLESPGVQLPSPKFPLCCPQIGAEVVGSKLRLLEACLRCSSACLYSVGSNMFATV